MAIFGVKTRLLWQAGYQSRNPPGNCFMSHITSHYIAKHVTCNAMDRHIVHWWEKDKTKRGVVRGLVRNEDVKINEASAGSDAG